MITRRRAVVFVEDWQFEHLSDFFRDHLPDCQVEKILGASDLQESSQNLNELRLRPILVISESKLIQSGLSVADVVSQLRLSKLFLPIVCLAKENSPLTRSSQPFDSVFSVDESATSQKLGDVIDRAMRLADDFYELQKNTSRFRSLSTREVEIIRLATEGVPNKSIARRLDVSVKTVEKNRRNAYIKLRVSTAAEMATLVTFQRFCHWSAGVMTASN